MTKYFKEQFAIYGDKTDIPNDIQPSGTVSYQAGFPFDYQRKLGVDPLAKPFPRQGFNGLVSDITGALQQYQQYGFFDFITPEMNGGESFEYSMGASVRYDMSDTQDGSDVRNFSSLINKNKTNPKEGPTNWKELGSSQGGYGFPFISISTNTILTEQQTGVVLIDASADAIDITLPETTNNISFIFKRIDNTVNAVKIKTSRANKIKYNLSINPNGYSFFNLFGAGDYWQIISDGIGNWFDIDRADKKPQGDIGFIASSITPSGGYIIANGSLLNRVDYPYLWDYAQKSGALVDDANRTDREGCFSRGDGSTTFRVPDLRGVFLRSLDNSKGIDTSRLIGAFQSDAIRNIKGSMKAGSIEELSGTADGALGIIKTAYPGASGGYTDHGFDFDASRVVPTAEENRPKNIAYPIYLKII